MKETSNSGMKQFFTTALGAFVGTIVAVTLLSVISFIFTIVMMIGLAASVEKSPEKIDNNSILLIDLTTVVTDLPVEVDPFSEIMGEKQKSISLKETLAAIKVAQTNDKIKGIYLKCGEAEVGYASAYEIRKALDDFKKSEKWIYAYGNEFIGQKSYYIATAADSIFINPQGIIDMPGLAITTPFFKPMLDKIGVTMQVFKVGTFKSAVEPFILDSISDANRLQQKTFLTNMWNVMSSEMAESRGTKIQKLNQLSDSMVITLPVDSLIANKLVDNKYYKSDFVKLLKKKVNIDEKDDLNLVSVSTLAKHLKKENSDNKIAVIYAIGEINSASNDGIVASKVIEQIEEAAKDDDVKGLVMRVNSPGGSAFDSEQIWAALEDFKKTNKPFAVSMGDYAASGGYYISCGADRIFAEPTTLTGSIGIFGMIPCAQELVNNKIGINLSVVETNANGGFGNIVTPFTPYQKYQFQKMINRGYELFTTRCAEGRDMPIDSLKMIAEGRVWDGNEALKLNLVDEIGGLDLALEYVASAANIADYQLLEMRREKDLMERLESLFSMKVKQLMIDDETLRMMQFTEEAKSILKQDRIQARMQLFEVK